MATATDYARLEERILARDQVGASTVLYGLMKDKRPVNEIVAQTVRIHAPYTHVPYHQRLDDGMVKFVNNDHCLLSERVALPLMSLLPSQLRYLPLAQSVWYMPTGLDPWNQLLGKAPGHYTRLYEIKVDQTPPKPEAHWPDQEPVRLDGPIGERLNHWLTLVQRGDVLPAYRVFLGLMEDAPHPGRDPGRRRAGDPRDGRAQQLFHVAARLRVLQHARLVLRHVRAPARAQAALRRRVLHQPRRRAPGQHPRQRPADHRAAAGRGEAGRRPAPRAARGGAARPAPGGVGRAHGDLSEVGRRPRGPDRDAGHGGLQDRQRSPQPGAGALPPRGLSEDAGRRPGPPAARVRPAHGRASQVRRSPRVVSPLRRSLRPVVGWRRLAEWPR